MFEWAICGGTTYIHLLVLARGTVFMACVTHTHNSSQNCTHIRSHTARTVTLTRVLADRDHHPTMEGKNHGLSARVYNGIIVMCYGNISCITTRCAKVRILYC